MNRVGYLLLVLLACVHAPKAPGVWREDLKCQLLDPALPDKCVREGCALGPKRECSGVKPPEPEPIAPCGCICPADARRCAETA